MDEAGEADVADARPAVAIDEDVARADVAVDQGLVRKRVCALVDIGQTSQEPERQVLGLADDAPPVSSTLVPPAPSSAELT